MEAIGVVGLHGIGASVARRLLERGRRLRLYDPVRAHTDALQGDSAEVVPAPAYAAEPGGIVVSALDDDEELAEASLGPEGILTRLGARGLHVAMGNISPDALRFLADRHAELGAGFVAARMHPMKGSRTPDAWSISLAGHRTSWDRARRLAGALAGEVLVLGEDPGEVAEVETV